jgi:uncharacterized membrane protein
MMMSDGMGWMWMGGAFGLLGLWAFVALAAGSFGGPSKARGCDPLDTLRHRLADGQVTAEQYDEIRQVLSADTTATRQGRRS